jgi:hypothetical protein
MSSNQAIITIAGDICIDWLQFPITAKDSGLNWELYSGTGMIAKSGGVLMLAEFLRRSTCATVIAPELTEIKNKSPEQVIHSNAELELKSYSTDSKDKGKLVYRVKEFNGFIGPNTCSMFSAIKNDDSNSQIVVLDDAGNGFRDCPQYWPKAITEEGKKPIVIYKVSRPLAQGKLWEHLCKNHADRLIIIANADDVRSSGVNISRCLSWEKTALDFVWQMASNPKLLPLANCSNIIIRFGLDGVIHYIRKDAKVESRLYFDPLSIEGEFKAKYPGEMQYLYSAFAAALVTKIAKFINYKELDTILPDGIRSGFSSARRLFKYGFGSTVNQPDIPNAEFFTEEKDPEAIADIVIPNPTVAEPADPNFWCILKEFKGSQLEDIAYDIVVKGEKASLGQVPVGQFKELKTVDRAEIEGFRSISNLMREYIATKNPPRPLSIAVFGSPGSGKSFGVVQVANSIQSDVEIEKIEFNVSQFTASTDLISAFHKVRDIVLSGKIPLVFFDEFDSPLGTNYGWLKYFLAPMQDGKFREGETIHPIGKAIFVFAGGVNNSFKEFSEKVSIDNAIKGPDFISRLRGYVNILGPNCSDGNETLYMIRRAMLLRSLIERKAKLLLDNNNRIRIDSGVLRALIKVPKYSHAARSMEAIIDMSTLNKQNCWEQAFLPPKEQLKLHVDEEMFSRLVVRDVLLGAAREILAKAIHEQYVKDQEKNKPASDPAMQPWEKLSENLKESNRRQADHIPEKLRRVGYSFSPKAKEKSNIVEFKKEEIEIMAELEHERWVSERLLGGWVYSKERDPDKKISPYLVPWKDLPEIKDKKKDPKEWDRKAVKRIPKMLDKLGFEIYKLR